MNEYLAINTGSSHSCMHEYLAINTGSSYSCTNEYLAINTDGPARLHAKFQCDTCKRVGDVGPLTNREILF